MNWKRLAFTMTLLALALAGCHSGSGTTSSPGGLQITIAAGMVNTALAPTILDAQLLFDGVVAVDAPSSTGVAIVSLSTAGATSSGSHTLAFLIASQTSTPNNYTVPAPTIQVFDANGNFLKTLNLTTTTASLATGQSINYNFTL